MRIKIAVPEAFVQPDVVNAALEAVTRLDEHMIRTGQTPTSRELISRGAIWRPEDPGDEHFDHGGTIASRGWGDCDDWAPLHAATLRASGEDPGATAVVYPSGPSTYHAVVNRSDGSIDDPSVAAGMKPARKVSGGGGCDGYECDACDPIDGRPYVGQLLPAVSPLSVHCGPGFAVRAANVVGAGMLYEGRCDLPIHGSPLVAVRSYVRHRGHRGRGRRVHGVIPYAFSTTAYGTTPMQALEGAIVGAILCGDAAEIGPNLDRYKLLATQAALHGASPGQVHQALVAMMTKDIQAHAAATGTDPAQYTHALLAQLAAETNAIHGYIVGDIFSDIGHAASGVVSAVSSVVNDVSKAANIVPWGDIIHGVEAAVSVVPGIGTALSDVVAAAETAYDEAAAILSGNALQGAIQAAYNFALASLPGAAALRFVLDPVVDGLLKLTIGHEPIESAILNSLLDQVPDAPKIGSVSPRSIAASIAHMIVSHLGVKNTGKADPAKAKALVSSAPPVFKGAALPHLSPAAVTAAAHALAAARAATQRAGVARAAAKRAPAVVRPAFHLPAIHLPPMTPAQVKQLGVPHAAVHVTQAAQLARAAALPGRGTTWRCQPIPGGGWDCRWM